MAIKRVIMNIDKLTWGSLECLIQLQNTNVIERNWIRE
jgi:hypothetical protein